MAGAIVTNVQLGDNLTATNNFVLSADAADGTMKLARGNYGGSNTDILKVSASGGDIALISTGAALTNVASMNGGPLAGFRNRIINGDFSVWQRGVSTTTTVGYVSADRWYLDGGSAQTIAKSSTPSSPAGNYYLQSTYGASAYLNIGQAIESSTVTKMRGLPFTVSCQIKSTGTAYTGYITLAITYSNSTDAYASVSTTVTRTSTITVSPTSSWQKAVSTFVVPVDAVGLKIYAQHSVSQSAGAVLHIGDFQLEPGYVATPFEFRPYAVELALCQRYYQRLTPDATGNRQIHGNATSTTNVHFMYNFPVKLRIPPTALEQSGVATDYSIATQGTTVNCSSVPTFSSSTVDASLTNYTTASGLTAGYACLSRSNNGSAGFLAWSAEL